MRILIADDEELTRNGIASSIHWDQLHIHSIDTADDGVNALLCAQKNLPDILLTDVRMPRMDGIELSRRLRKLNPNCAIIFMSGYSDKEYLKAAINLKAVSYVEKPFVSSELLDALKEAAAQVQQTKIQLESQQFFIQEAGSRLALNLTQPFDTAQLDGAALKLYDSLPADLYFTTMILQIHDFLQNSSEDVIAAFTGRLHECVRSYRMDEIHTLKRSDYLILHVYAPFKPLPQTLTALCSSIGTLFSSMSDSEHAKNYFIVLGDTVHDLTRVYESYNSAALLLQSAFFYEYGSILTPFEAGTGVDSAYLIQIPERFSQKLSDKNEAAVLDLCDELYGKLLHNRMLLQGTVREVYYRLLTICSNQQYEWKLSTPAVSESHNLLDRINSCQTLTGLHHMLCRHIAELFSRLKNQEQESATIFLIKEYINANYSDDALSIKDISDHVHLSSSYLCTVFKTETGQTLNQYLTSLRIEKAKQMLLDPRNKINEISQQVGYCDCNYFGKTFKKVVGVSPSEYREKELS